MIIVKYSLQQNGIFFKYITKYHEQDRVTIVSSFFSENLMYCAYQRNNEDESVLEFHHEKDKIQYLHLYQNKNPDFLKKV